MEEEPLEEVTLLAIEELMVLEDLYPGTNGLSEYDGVLYQMAQQRLIDENPEYDLDEYLTHLRETTQEWMGSLI